MPPIHPSRLGLAELYRRRGSNARALDQLGEALRAATARGDRATADMARSQIARIKGTAPPRPSSSSRY
jgi:hypothetical protein